MSLLMNRLTARYVLLIALASELFLASIYYAWAWHEGQLGFSFPSPAVLLASIVFTIPLALANYLVLLFVCRRTVGRHDEAGDIAEAERSIGGFCVVRETTAQFSKFVEEVVRPLVTVLDPFSAVLVAALAGFGEELFFRGVLQNEFGLIIASLAFSLLHFGTAARDYYLVVLWYALIGLYLGVIYQVTETLWVPGLVHFFYDVLVIYYLKSYSNFGSSMKRRLPAS